MNSLQVSRIQIDPGQVQDLPGRFIKCGKKDSLIRSRKLLPVDRDRGVILELSGLLIDPAAGRRTWLL